jgi:ATP-dependent DNA helicase RecG
VKLDKFENLNTEFKREYTEDIKKTIAAFANSSGGTLYIGVEDDGTVRGLDDPGDTVLRVSNAVRNAIKPDLSLFVDYDTENMGGKPVIRVRVQKGTAPPYYLAGKGIRPEGVYIRQGASSVPASETVILTMLRETGGEKYEEARSLNQDLSFREAEEFFKTKNVPFGPSQRKSLRLQSPDGVYTNLGLLLSDQAVHTVKLAVFEGLEKEIFKDRREFSGSLLRQLNEAYEFLDMYNHTRAEMRGLYRFDHRDYPEDALREALLNALAHRDYAFSGSTLINVFDNRIEFVSLGGLPRGISLEDIMLGLSVPRNENLANVFYRLRLIEAYGTGIPRILRGYTAGGGKPALQATGNAFKVTLPNRNAGDPGAGEPALGYGGGEGGYVNAGYVASPRVIYGGDPGGRFFLTENEEKTLAMLERQPVIIRKDVERALEVSQPMAVRVLRGLLDKGLLQSIGRGKNTRYRRR